MLLIGDAQLNCRSDIYSYFNSFQIQMHLILIIPIVENGSTGLLETFQDAVWGKGSHWLSSYHQGHPRVVPIVTLSLVRVYRYQDLPNENILPLHPCMVYKKRILHTTIAYVSS